jgi:hypothetical protein
MDLKFETEATFVNEDHSWLASRLGFDTARPITLDLSTFVAGTHYPNGFIPSGMALGQKNADSLYGPYGASPSEIQTITVDATGGTFTVTFDGEVTGALAFNISAANLQAALEGLASLNPGDVVVTGGPGAAGGGTPYTLTFGGRFLGQNVPAVVTAAGALTGGASTAAVATTQAGGGVVNDGRETGRGLLLASTIVRSTNTTGKAVAALLWQGIVRQSRLPANHGVDAAFRNDVPTIRWEA